MQCDVTKSLKKVCRPASDDPLPDDRRTGVVIHVLGKREELPVGSPPPSAEVGCALIGMFYVRSVGVEVEPLR